MKTSTKRSALSQVFFILKWGKITAKIAAVGTTLTGIVAAITSSSAATGIAMGAAGATTYAATKNLAGEPYEKTKHIAPGIEVLKDARSQHAVIAGVRKISDAQPKAPVKADGTPEVTIGNAPEENPFAWVEENKAQEATPIADFLERPPVMVVTMEEEEELDETGTKVRKIRKTALNFVAPKEVPSAGTEAIDDPIPV